MGLGGCPGGGQDVFCFLRGENPHLRFLSLHFEKPTM